jgi:TrmH family RNA methyltransferase
MKETITSAQNQKIRELRKLHEHKHRERTGLFLAEGEDMLTEALRHGACPQEVFYDPDGLLGHGLLESLPESASRTPVRADVLAGASALGSGTRVIGVWPQRWAETATWTPAPVNGEDMSREVAVYLHEVRDPSNVGAVVRSAFALVPSIVVLSPRTADPFGPKAVRASMGAVFGQPITAATFERARAATSGRHRAIALVPGAGRRLRDVDLGGPVLFCLGAERSGLPDSIASSCDEVAHVPLRAEGAESLNVAMTATLCLYESALHRLSPTHD